MSAANISICVDVFVDMGLPAAWGMQPSFVIAVFACRLVAANPAGIEIIRVVKSALLPAALVSL